MNIEWLTQDKPMLVGLLCPICFYLAAPTITTITPVTAFVEEHFGVETIAEYLDQTEPKREQFIEIHNAALISLLLRFGSSRLFDDVAELQLMKIDTENFIDSVTYHEYQLGQPVANKFEAIDFINMTLESQFGSQNYKRLANGPRDWCAEGA
ncbi:hypothetical protein [Vibrio europaeus]|uniref:Uncharacterized protein n=1 Tax=Vibrio europaeus TaxID=300876 RepID=A0ABT5GS48_9VIBR|nr:hypothetical protein [Vibrio europaeus]MDC5725676.1 hypothetical protein [Vibrio europaeus]MDC5728278.1 hypothetical protein [Vibrio europaeus]MDC5734490.1 hypothetical protein [Vibrio europaeus]MDC5739771.1 hypothetical protein [Vibrio europaeus]